LDFYSIKNNFMEKDNKNAKKCTKCGKKIDIFDTFPNDVCVDCYEIEFEKMSDDEKIPIFSNKMINI